MHHTSVSLKGHLCTPYVCVVKGSPVHHTSVSLSQVISVHLMYMSLRGHLYCVVKSHLCTPYVCVVKGSPLHHTSVSLRVISVNLMYICR